MIHSTARSLLFSVAKSTPILNTFFYFLFFIFWWQSKSIKASLPSSSASLLHSFPFFLFILSFFLVIRRQYFFTFLFLFFSCIPLHRIAPTCSLYFISISPCTLH